MASKFNPVPAQELHKALQEAGFTEKLVGREIVYELANHNISCLKVCIFTSAHVGHDVVAECGKDAIRSTLIFTRSNGTTVCVKKGTRVFRVGKTEAIIDRMLNRGRELYGMANQIAKIRPCAKCAAPCYFESQSCVTRCGGKAVR